MNLRSEVFRHKSARAVAEKLLGISSVVQEQEDHGKVTAADINKIQAEINKLTAKGMSQEKAKEKALKQGMRTLRQDGWEKIKMGITTPSEVIRVTEAEVIE